MGRGKFLFGGFCPRPVLSSNVQSNLLSFYSEVQSCAVYLNTFARKSIAISVHRKVIIFIWELSIPCIGKTG